MSTPKMSLNVADHGLKQVVKGTEASKKADVEL